MTLDPRLHAFRSDLADSRLKGQVEATAFVEGVKYRIAEPVADIRTLPRFDSGVATQLICGQDVLVFERREGFAWVQALDDGYTGYVNDAVLESAAAVLTHRVNVPRTFLYPAADLRLSPVVPLSLGSRLAVVGKAKVRGTSYALLANGAAVIQAHLAPLSAPVGDFVSVAESLVRTPYLWGGTSAFGIDCSGLVQLSLAVAGRHVRRDSDMQGATIGKKLSGADGLRRGDLVFWPGHVAIMTDEKKIIHANGASMDVRVEVLQQARARLKPLYGQPTCFRRP